MPDDDIINELRECAEDSRASEGDYYADQFATAPEIFERAAAEIERLRWRVMTLESAAKYAAGRAEKETYQVNDEYEQVPVIGGPLDGQTHRLRLTASKWIVPDSADMIHGVKDGEPYTLFGQHIYELKCYAKGGERVYQWEHVGYQKPVEPK